MRDFKKMIGKYNIKPRDIGPFFQHSSTKLKSAASIHKDEQRQRNILANKVIRNEPPKIPVKSLNTKSSKRYPSEMAETHRTSEGRFNTGHSLGTSVMNSQNNLILDNIQPDISIQNFDTTGRDIETVNESEPVQQVINFESLEDQNSLLEAFSKLLDNKAKERAIRIKENVVAQSVNKKDVKKFKLKKEREPEESKEEVIEKKRGGLESVSDKFQNLSEVIESELGITGSATATAMALNKKPHPKSLNKKLKKQSLNMMKQLRLSLRQFKKMEKQIKIRQLKNDDDGEESDDEEYQKWKLYSLNVYNRVTLEEDQKKLLKQMTRPSIVSNNPINPVDFNIQSDTEELEDSS